ncbi:MAG: YitT family protein [Lewinellaceae bacterium]|nr:YitT family protein [Saprospiraceae bacterium]MCB9337751.1 YitT family protein [Lewinellaceae bacterium]
MSPFFQQIIIDHLRKHPPPKYKGGMSEKALKKEAQMVRVSLFHWVKDALLIGVGILSAGFGLKGFLLPNDFIDGGVTGISLLVANVSGWPLPVLLVVINAPFILLGLTQLGRRFALKSIFAIAGLSMAVAFITYPVITSDKLLVAVFGGFFLGAGIGLAVRGGAVLDGTEVLAIYINRRTPLTIGDIILLFNIIIFSIAAWLLSLEVALYSILTYLSASKTVDFIIEGLDEYMGVTIISPLHEEIRQMIVEKLGRGATLYAGKGGYGQESKDLKSIEIVFSVVTRLELARLKKEVEKIDPSAFIIMNAIRDIKGGVIKRKPLQH